MNELKELIAEGETRHVCTRVNEKPKRSPEELISLTKPYLRNHEEGEKAENEIEPFR